MKVLFDTNVVLDVLMKRDPHVDSASKLFALVDHGRLEGAICATTVTTIFHIAAESFGRRRTQAQVRELLGLSQIAPVGRDVLSDAPTLDFTHYEDAVIHEAARAIGATAIVTRDRGCFVNSLLPVLDPRELLASIAAARVTY